MVALITSFFLLVRLVTAWGSDKEETIVSRYGSEEDWGHKRAVSVWRECGKEGQAAGFLITVDTYDSVVCRDETAIIYYNIGQVQVKTDIAILDIFGLFVLF